MEQPRFTLPFVTLPQIPLAAPRRNLAGIERMNNDLIYQDHSRLNEDETVALQERLYREITELDSQVRLRGELLEALKVHHTNLILQPVQQVVTNQGINETAVDESDDEPTVEDETTGEDEPPVEDEPREDSRPKIPSRWSTFVAYDGDKPRTSNKEDIDGYFISRIFHRDHTYRVRDGELNNARNVWNHWRVDITRANKLTQLFIEGAGETIPTMPARLLSTLSNYYQQNEMPAVIMRLYAQLKVLAKRPLRVTRRTDRYKSAICQLLNASDCKAIIGLHKAGAVKLGPEELKLTYNDLPERFIAGWEAEVPEGHPMFEVEKSNEEATTGNEEEATMDGEEDEATEDDAPPSKRRRVTEYGAATASTSTYDAMLGVQTTGE